MGYCDESVLNSRSFINDESVLPHVMKLLDPSFQSDDRSRQDHETEIQPQYTDRGDLWKHWATVAAIVCSLGISVLLLTSDGRAAATGSPYLGARQLVAGMLLALAIFIACQQVWLDSLRNRLRNLHIEAVALQQMALIDPLTGLYNRWVAQDRLPQEIVRCERLNRPLIVLCLDVNSLKSINDTYGHLVGDTALQGLGQRIRETVRLTDVPVRLGGDEFLVLLPDCNPDEVTTIVGRLRGLEIEAGGERIPVTFSAGWTICQGGESPEQLLERADERLYNEKRMIKKTGNRSRRSQALKSIRLRRASYSRPEGEEHIKHQTV